MAKSYDIKRYSSWSFDDYYCLKPPAPLVLSIIFLCRSFLLVGTVMLTSLKGTTSDLASLLSGGDHPTSLAATGIPALLVLYALVRRTPRGGRFVRWIWRYGRVFLAASAAMAVTASGLFLYSYSSGGARSEADVVAISLLILDLYILTYLLFAKRVRDTFSDFPPPLELIDPPRSLRSETNEGLRQEQRDRRMIPEAELPQ